MYLNPKSDKKTEIEYGDVIFREGDKVMQIKNNYQIEWEVLNRYQIPLERGIGIFNGDIGFIQKIDQTTEQVAASAEEQSASFHEVNASSESLAQMATELHEITSRFKL